MRAAERPALFRRVGRRLALLNALIVIGVILLTGAVTWIALRRSLDREVDHALEDRLALFLARPEVVTALTPSLPEQRDEPRDEDADEATEEAREELEDAREDAAEEAEEIVESGDTIVFLIALDGTVTGNTRGIALPGLPVAASAERALAGERDVRTVGIDDAGAVRVMSVPILTDGAVTGAAQAARSLREHDRELALVRWMVLLGVGLGVAIAVPAGLWLASRAMRPIGAAFDRQRAFVADASHELRTPLTIVRANAEYALMDPGKRVEAVQPELASILDEVARTDRLVDDLLTLARADAGKLELRRVPLDPAVPVGAAVERLRPLYEERDVALTADLTAGSPIPLDGERIEQLLRILLANALEHTPSGGEVAVTLARAGARATLSVRDTGSGIPPEDLPHVFERFYRADRARTRATGGTGLGLPIARSLVGAHGGTIAITSTPGAGTTVTVTL